MKLFFLLIPKLYMGVTLKKNDLIAQVASSSGLSKSDAGKALDAVLDSITSALASGDEVRIIGFGTFS
ncbi:MAG: HU family DNA-binding protein, partial [Candidatus Puniceispirillales bacterium]